jgi:TPR repeat protein
VTVRAELGDSDAKHALCYEYLYGSEERPKNYELAFRWCTAAAEAGNPNSQTLLAEMYRFGLHVDKNNDKAKDYYLLAAKQGHVHAQFMLGRLAILNEENPDTHQFCYWTRAAAAQNYEKAIEQLNFMEQGWRELKGPSALGFCDSAMSKKQPAN